MKTDYCEKKIEALNWKLKNNGYEIIKVHGQRSTFYYPAKASNACDYVEQNFDSILAFLGSHEDKKKDIYMRIKGIGIVFDIRQLTAEETKARQIMNKLGLGEREVEYKTRARSKKKAEC